MFHQGNFAN